MIKYTILTLDQLSLLEGKSEKLLIRKRSKLGSSVLHPGCKKGEIPQINVLETFKNTLEQLKFPLRPIVHLTNNERLTSF